MRKAISIIALLIPAIASSAPFVNGQRSGLVSTDTCTMQEGAGAPVTTAVVMTPTPHCSWDAAGFSEGSHTVSLTVNSVDPVWGTLSSAPFSFTFTRPSAPAPLTSGSVVATP